MSSMASSCTIAPMRRRSSRRAEQCRDLALAILGAHNGTDMVLRRVIDRHIDRVLDATEGNLSLAADLLGMDRRSLQRYCGADRGLYRGGTQLLAANADNLIMQWIEPSTVRDGLAARVVDRHADETRRVRVTGIKPSRDDATDFELPTVH